MVKFIKQWFWLIVLIVTLVILFYGGFGQYLTFDYLKQHRALLLYWVNTHYLVTVSVFISLYILLVAVSFPGASYLTIISGFLFGVYFGTIYSVMSATIGAFFLFWAARLAINPLCEQHIESWVSKMRKGFHEHEVRYLLFLRLLPIFPFWAVNVAAAILNVRMITFTIVTFIGVIPGAFIYALLGSGLGRLFEQNKTPNMMTIFDPYIFLPLAGLATLIILPALYSKWRYRHKEGQPHA